MHSLDGSLVTLYRKGIGTSYDDQIRVYLIFLDGTNFHRQFLCRHHRFALKVAASFWEHLIFDMETGDTRAFEPLKRMQCIQRVSIARIAIP